MSGQMFNDRGAIVSATGTAHLIEVRVQQLLEPGPATPNTGVMELDLESLQFREEVGHASCFALCGLTLELSCPRRKAL